MPFAAETRRVRPCFELLHHLRDQAVTQNGALTELSMGTSGDFEEAIFGKCSTPDGHYWA